MNRRKTLRQHADDGHFRPSRHAALLATDDSLLPYLLDENRDPDGYLMELADLVLLFRASESVAERRAIMRAFAGYVNRGERPRRLTRAADGAPLRWLLDDERREWYLVECGCGADVCQCSDSEPVATTPAHLTPALRDALAAWKRAHLPTTG